MIEMQPYITLLSRSIGMTSSSLYHSTKSTKIRSQMTMEQTFSIGGTINSMGSVSRKAINEVA